MYRLFVLCSRHTGTEYGGVFPACYASPLNICLFAVESLMLRSRPKYFKSNLEEIGMVRN